MRGLLLLVALVASTACAQSLEQAAVRLANRVVKTAAGRSITVQFENRSTLAPIMLDRVRALAAREFRRFQGTAEPSVPVTITISENAAGPLLIARIEQDDALAVLIERFDREHPSSTAYRASLRLRAVRVQTSPVLDFAIAENALFVLEPTQVAAYRPDQERWKPAGEFPLPLPTAPPRDVRGRLLIKGPLIEVHVPGASCIGSFETAAMKCNDEDTPWREAGIAVTWVPRRNFLTSPAMQNGAFYTAAALPDNLTLAATTKGTLNVALNEKFGTDLAGISAACIPGAVIVTGRGTDSDMVQAMDFSDGQARALTDALPLPGPVVALWTAEAPDQVSVVVRNAKTGDYEASRLGVSCDR